MGCFSREGKRGEGEAFFLALPRMKGKKSFEQVLEWITWPRKSNLCDAILPVKAVKSMLHFTFHEHCQGRCTTTLRCRISKCCILLAHSIF